DASATKMSTLFFCRPLLRQGERDVAARQQGVSRRGNSRRRPDTAASCSCRTGRYQQIFTTLELIKDRGAADTRTASELRGPKHATRVRVVRANVAVAADPEQQSARRHDDAVAHLRNAGSGQSVGGQ